MSKLIVKEGHIEAAAVKASMKELESLQKMQKAAAQVSFRRKISCQRFRSLTTVIVIPPL